MNNQELTNEKRQALIECIDGYFSLRRQYNVVIGDDKKDQIYSIALAALTAEPVKVPDEMHTLALQAGDSHGYGMGWNACRAEVLRLNAIDNTAQQYEALAGKSETPPPPEPPTAPPIYIGNKPAYIRKPGV